MKILDRLFFLAGGLLLGQFPAFFLQYTHELNGRLAELTYQNSILEQAAALSKRTLPQLIDKFISSGDPDFARQGAFMQSIEDRLNLYTQAYQAFQNAPLWQKPFLFLRYADRNIFLDTLHHFEWGINFSLESLVYVAVGGLCGMAAYRILQAARGYFTGFRTYPWSQASKF